MLHRISMPFLWWTNNNEKNCTYITSKNYVLIIVCNTYFLYMQLDFKQSIISQALTKKVGSNIMMRFIHKFSILTKSI